MEIKKKELKAQWPVETKVSEYTAKEVAAHNTKDDMWIIIHGQVFDVSKYGLDHPGGFESLIEVAGQDATSAYEDVGHSEDAREIMQPYLCGVLKDASSATTYRENVKVVRQEPVIGQTISQNYGWRSAVLTVGGAIGSAAGIFYILQNPRLLSALKHYSASTTSIKLGEHGFVNGFLLASGASAIFNIYLAGRISKVFSIKSGLAGYPIRIKSSPKPMHHVVGFLQAQNYQKLPLVGREDLPGQKLVRLTFALPKDRHILGLPIGQHVAIRAKVGDQMVSRSYTPTSSNMDLGKLVLVLRIYDDGLLTGGYLSHLKLGDEVEFRGPKGAMRYRKGYAKKIGMVAGGTGITPMYQLIRAICEDDTDTTEINLVYANRSEDEIILRDELERLAKNYPQNIHLWYMLDNHSPGWQYGVGFVDQKVLQEHMPAPTSDGSAKVLLCGPPGMVNATKKNLELLGWKKAGAVSKMTDDVFCF